MGLEFCTYLVRMQHLKEKFKLDRIAETRLSDILARCSDEKKDEYYHDLERPGSRRL